MEMKKVMILAALTAMVTMIGCSEKKEALRHFRKRDNYGGHFAGLPTMALAIRSFMSSRNSLSPQLSEASASGNRATRFLSQLDRRIE